MDLTFRLPGPWGSGKGSNLQPTEVDNNFWSLAEAILDLQSNPAQPVGIASISVSGTQMTITLTDGTVMGPFTLPVLTFRWRGEYEESASYAELDVFTVTSGNPWIADPSTVRYGIFMVQIALPAAPLFDPDLEIGGLPAFLQLFGSVDTLLSTLADVDVDEPPGFNPLIEGHVLRWSTASEKWVNSYLGTMAVQDANAVNITGGNVGGLPAPLLPGDAATKAYVDALPAGMMVDDRTMMSNISGLTGPALPNTLSDFLDYALLTSVRGTMLYRGGAGWEALEPGAEGLFLQTHDAGLDPTWAPGGAGVVSIDAGPGIDTGGATIIDTGTISLAEIADDTFLANIAGVPAPPSGTTLTVFLDSVLGSARGTILTRGVGGWAALAPGTSGQYLKTQGAGADAAWDSPIGAGTVTSVAAGTGITTGGSPITSTGSVSLATIATNTVLANTSGSTAAPIATTPTLLLDQSFGTTQGAVLYRAASAWVILSPGTSGQFLATGGAAANPSWQNAPTTGAAIPTSRIISNISGSNATPSGNSLTNILDAIVSSSRGTLLYRAGGGWAGLAPGTSGQVLQTGGAAGDPSWTAAPGATAIANARIMANISGGSAAPIGNTLSAIFDNILGTTRGMLIYRDGTSWRTLAAGTAGQLLRTGGTAGDPSWITVSAGGGISQLTGDVTAGPGTGAQVATLANTAVTAGSYTGADITVDAKGRITAAANGTGGGGGGISDAPSDGTSYGRLNATWAAVAPLASPTFSGTPAAPTATAGTNTTQIANTAFVTTAVAGAAAGINQLSGDVIAGPGSGSQAATLSNTAVAPGSYTAADITVDAKGRITAAANGAGGVSPPSPHPGYRSGVYYTRQLSAVGTNGAMTANRIYATPVFVASAITIDAVQIYVGTPGAGGTLADIGIYANANGAVGSLVRDFGTVTTAASAVQAITGVTQALAAGWYFLAVGFSGTPSVITTAATDVSAQHLLGISALGTSFQGFQGWIASWTFAAGALPTTLSGPTQNASGFPLVAFRVQ